MELRSSVLKYICTFFIICVIYELFEDNHVYHILVDLLLSLFSYIVKMSDNESYLPGL